MYSAVKEEASNRATIKKNIAIILHAESTVAASSMS